jgi:hypothetical protein
LFGEGQYEEKRLMYTVRTVPAPNSHADLPSFMTRTLWWWRERG